MLLYLKNVKFTALKRYNYKPKTAGNLISEEIFTE